MLINLTDPTSSLEVVVCEHALQSIESACSSQLSAGPSQGCLALRLVVRTVLLREVFDLFDLVFSGHGPEALTNTVALQLARAGCEENVVNFILKANRCATASSDGSVSCKSNVIKYIHKANKPAL